MRERSRDRGRLLDMQQYAKNVDVIIQGVSFEDFVSDIRIYYSTMKNIEVIGEAAYMLTPDFKTAHPELPWRQIVDMRHILVHGYAQVSPRDLWDTAKNDLPPLLIQIEKYLNTVNWCEWETPNHE